MFFLRDNFRHPEFRIGTREFQSLAPGIAAWGLMTGVAMSSPASASRKPC